MDGRRDVLAEEVEGLPGLEANVAHVRQSRPCIRQSRPYIRQSRP
jgi:hypothetical protein